MLISVKYVSPFGNIIFFSTNKLFFVFYQNVFNFVFCILCALKKNDKQIDMDINEVTDKVKRFLVDEFEIEEEKILPEARLKEDLGIDSLDFVDIVVIVEDVFGFKLNSEEVKKLVTFSEFCNHIQTKTE